jgi:hypothetical protein
LLSLEAAANERILLSVDGRFYDGIIDGGIIRGFIFTRK